MSKKYYMNKETKKIEEVVVKPVAVNAENPGIFEPEIEAIIADEEAVFETALDIVGDKIEVAAPAEATNLNIRCVQDSKVLKKYPEAAVSVVKDGDKWTYYVAGKIVAEFYVPFGRWTIEP